MTATLDDVTNDLEYGWALDEAYHLSRLKTKVMELFDGLRGTFLPQSAEMALCELRNMVREDDLRTTRIPADAGYPAEAGDDVAF